MNKSQSWVRFGFIEFLFGFILLFIVAALCLPAHVGGKPTPRDRAMRGCRDYLEYAKFASTNGEFKFDFSKLLEFDKVNGLRTIFNTNFLAKTNFIISISKPELVILCKEQFYYPRAKNSFGCSYSRLKPAFVVGYSDGTIALIPPEQFLNLNLTEFVQLNEFANQPIYGASDMLKNTQTRP